MAEKLNSINLRPTLKRDPGKNAKSHQKETTDTAGGSRANP